MVSTFYWVLWKPYSKRKFYEKQGIRGPVFRPFIGNLPEIQDLRRGVPKLGGQISESPARRVGTELFVFSEKYGKIFDNTILLYVSIRSGNFLENSKEVMSSMLPSPFRKELTGSKQKTPSALYSSALTKLRTLRFGVSGKVSVFEQGSMTRMILADAKLAKEVLLSKAGYYKRSVLTTEVISAIAGHGSILTAEGGNWKQKNQIMSPAFRHTFLKASWNPRDV